MQKLCPLAKVAVMLCKQDLRSRLGSHLREFVGIRLTVYSLPRLTARIQCMLYIVIVIILLVLVLVLILIMQQLQLSYAIYN